MIARRLVQVVSRPLLTNTHRNNIFFGNLNRERFFGISVAMKERIPFSPDFFFRQLFDEKSWTYTYLLADISTNEAIIIDPGNLRKHSN